MTLPRLLLLTNRSQLPAGMSLLDHIAACVAAGATHVLLRELDLVPSQRADLAERLAALGAVVIGAHERVVGAAGLHQPSTAHGPVRGLVGRSCHTAGEVAIAAADGCTYVSLGPFAATTSKPGYLPIDASVYADLPLPAYALGGITPDNARSALEAGAFGVAVMGEVMRSATPEAVVHALLQALS